MCYFGTNWLKLPPILFQPLKMGRNFVFGCVIVFSTQNQVPQINNHRTWLSDISYESPYSRVSNHIKNNFEFFLVSRKTGLKF